MPIAVPDLLAVLGIAKQHEGDHLDLAVLSLLHAAGHPLQHRPRAKALCQLVLLLPDLRMGVITISATHILGFLITSGNALLDQESPKDNPPCQTLPGVTQGVCRPNAMCYDCAGAA